MSTLRECPAGCGRYARPGHLMCVKCWREVPKDLQNEVYRTFRAWQRAPAGSMDAYLAYREARDNALGAIA